MPRRDSGPFLLYVPAAGNARHGPEVSAGLPKTDVPDPMFASPTFQRYIARQFVYWFLAVLAILAGVIAVVEFVEQVRLMSQAENGSLAIAVGLTAAKIPNTLELVFHFAVLIAAMFTFWRMTKSQELVVARAAGLSVWQFVIPVVIAALLIGIFRVTVFNPFSTALYASYERTFEQATGKPTAVFNLSRSGLWLRQKDENGVAVIHAEKSDREGSELRQVMFLLFDGNENYRGRADAEDASLGPDGWHLRRAWVGDGMAQPQYYENWTIPSSMTQDTIQERFASPMTISFWDLPDFARTMEETGFSSMRYWMAYQALLAQPALMAAMVLVAAAFSIRPGRRTDALLMVVGAIVTGFLVFVIGDIVVALGRAGTLPAPLAAWATAAVSLLGGVAALLYLEDG